MQHLHVKARMVAAVLVGLGHRPDKRLLRFNDVVSAAHEAAGFATWPRTPRERRRLQNKILIEMTEMCFSAVSRAYIPARGPLHEIEQYRLLAQEAEKWTSTISHSDKPNSLRPCSAR